MIDVEPIRPRIATIAAVVWLYLGAAWTLVGTPMLFAMSMLARITGDAIWLDILPVFFGGLALAGVLGLVGAVRLLQLRDIGRRLLERASWLTFAVVQLFSLRVAYGLSCTTDYFGNVLPFTNPGNAAPTVLAGLLFGVPFIVLARKLRSAELRFALRDAALRRSQ